jgi:hypothetical protein
MSDTMFAIRTPQHDFPLGTLASCVGTMGTAAYALVSEWLGQIAREPRWSVLQTA